MKKKNVFLMCGVAVGLVCFSPQMTNVSFAKEQQNYTIGEIIPKNGYIMAEELHRDPNNPYSAIYGYRGIDPKTISVIEQNGKKIFRFYARYFEGKKLKEQGTWWVEVDLYNNTFREEEAPEWVEIEHEIINNCDGGNQDFCYNVDMKNLVDVFIGYIKKERPDLYDSIIKDVQAVREKEAAAEKERLASQVDGAYQYAQVGLNRFAKEGLELSWDSFSQDSVDYTKVPQLSELVGHVFQLTDVYGFKSVRVGDTPTFRTDKRRNALVHFLPVQKEDGKWMICLMDDTGEFVGREYINLKPLIVHFKSYHEDYGYYKGLKDTFYKTGSFHTQGAVVGAVNLLEGLVGEGFVDVGIEKTDEAGQYRLVYYLTRMTTDSYGQLHQYTNKYDGYYATLTLVK